MNQVLERFCQGLYSRLTVTGQNVLISIYGLAYQRRRLGGNFARVVEEFRNRDRWPEGRMQIYLDESLQHMLLHAWNNVPYYRARWAAFGVRHQDLVHFRAHDLQLLPITPKVDLRLDADAFLASGTAERHRLLWEMTSGSTGEPIIVASSPRLQQAFLAAREARSFGWAGTSILLPRATIGGRMVVPRANSPGPYYRYNWAERQCYFSAFHISPEHVADYVNAFRRYRPRLLTGYSSSYYSLAGMMLAQNLTLGYRPDALILCADQLTPGMRQVIQEAFCARPYQEYGSTENAALATECEHGSLHANVDFGILEIVDDQGKPLPPGRVGRIICTGLLNDVQPLIRYDIGDLGNWSADRCRCGRDHLPVLKEIVGRVEDTIIAPDGREIVRIWSNLNLRHVIASQIVQERLDLLRVRVIPTDDFSEQDELLIKETIATKRLGNVRIEVERVLNLDRTACGKIRRVICRLPAQGAADLSPLPLTCDQHLPV